MQFFLGEVSWNNPEIHMSFLPPSAKAHICSMESKTKRKVHPGLDMGSILIWPERLTIVYQCIGLHTVAVNAENFGSSLVQEVVLLLHEGYVPGAAQRWIIWWRLICKKSSMAHLWDIQHQGTVHLPCPQSHQSAPDVNLKQ